MAKRFQYGVTYYPEHWPRAMWKRDVERIARAGFNIVRLGEGAWSYFEPREGHYQFDLFDEAIDLFAKKGIAVIFGTPTYCGPAWIAKNYPEVLRWNFNRIPMAHGSRRNYNYTSPKYIDLSDRICTAFASHYKNNKSIVGWQLDNEFNCHMDVSYAPSDTVAFRAWLCAKYKTLDALNDAWGTKFWSQTYDDWEQLDLPHPTSCFMNPTQLIDESRFISDCAVRFAKRQADILKKHNPKWPVTHNGLFANIDGPALAGVIDYFSQDQYPLFWHDWQGPAAKLQEARSLSFPYAVMEQQSGPGGQMAYLHRSLYPGEMAKWAMQSIAHGADKLLYFTWRTCPFGSEQHWHGLLDQDNRDSERLAEATALGKQLAKLPPAFFDAAPVKVAAVLRDFDNEVAESRVSTYTGAGRWEHGRWLAELGSAHVPVDVVWPSSPFDGYSLLVAPHLKLIDEKLVEKFTKFVKRGGTLVLGAQSGLMDRNGHIRQTTAPGPLAELAGVTVDRWTVVPEKEKRTLTLDDGTSFDAIAFAETLTLNGAKSIASWDDDALLGGRAAITVHRVGKGRVIYVGAYLPTESIAKLIKRFEADDLVLPVAIASPEVECVMRSDGRNAFVVLLNHAREPQCVEGLDPRAKPLLGKQRVTKDGSLVLESFEVLKV
ncbi:MAG: beta-galactosidase [Tepidisphaeraceae bacterium]